MNSPCNNIGATQPQKTTVLDYETHHFYIFCLNLII